MSDLNQCQFIGRLGRDVESRYTADGKMIANFSIAVGSQWKNKAGEKQESTEWVNCTAFDKLGEICGEYLKKGSQVFVSGKMKTRKWQDKEGKDHYTTEISIHDMQMLGSRQQAEESPESKPVAARQQTAPVTRGVDNFEDDIPF